MASKASGKAARARNASPSLPEVVDSNYMKDITKLKKLTGFIPQISYGEGIENMERYFSGLEKS